MEAGPRPAAMRSAPLFPGYLPRLPGERTIDDHDIISLFEEAKSTCLEVFFDEFHRDPTKTERLGDRAGRVGSGERIQDDVTILRQEFQEEFGERRWETSGMDPEPCGLAPRGVGI